MFVLLIFTLVMAFLWLVCHGIVLFFLFREFGVISTIFGVCCFLYAYVWGWSEWENDNPLKYPVMIIWTLVIVFYILGRNIIGLFVS